MTKKIKISIVVLYFIIFYQFSLQYYINVDLNNFRIFGAILNYSELFYFITFVFLLIKSKLLYPSIILKFIIFTFIIILYFMIEQGIIKLVMYGIGDSGGFIRNIIMEDTFYQFQWYEVLFWNFIFSLHYPVYIFIFLKPFVNHLDKSIRKIKEEKFLKTK